MNLKSRVTILVKALPQPSKSYIETVCCAGIDSDGHWKRLYPIRFRVLEDEKAFGRWDVVEFEYTLPKRDNRIESCHVYEDRLNIIGHEKSLEARARLLNSVVVGSEKDAIAKGHSLALIRPTNVKFSARRRNSDELALLRSRYSSLNKQQSLFDPELATFEPSPFEFMISFEDEGGMHNKQCGDWEVYATFRKFSKLYGEQDAIDRMQQIFAVDYPKKGVMFALGNMQKRPQTFQLLGIIRVDISSQSSLF